LRVAALGAGTGDCTGGAVVVTFSTLIASFENAEVLPGCTLRISATDQIPAGKTFTVRCGGSITVDSGVTLTINAFWRDPGMCQVFQATGANSGAGGTGIIQGLKFNRPEYWGAFGDCQANVSCTHDDAPPIQQCVNSAQNSLNGVGGDVECRLGNDKS
jgi:hypothetical protein